MMVVSAMKKTSAESTYATENVPPKVHYSAHPPWTDMITECITTIPDGTRHGVSRPAIKKFVNSKYHLSMNATTAAQLNRTITYGAQSGNFVLPKGPSGKVKLAPKRGGEITKENKKASPKHPVKTARGRTKEPPTPIPKTPYFAEEQRFSKTTPATRKYTSTAKKARVTPVPGRKVPARRATRKRGEAKSATVAKTRAATRRAAKSNT